MGLGSRFEGGVGCLVFSWRDEVGVLLRLDMEWKSCQSSTLKYQIFSGSILDRTAQVLLWAPEKYIPSPYRLGDGH